MPPVSVTIFASDPGTYFLEDDGIAGNNFSRIRFPDGTTVGFEHPTDDLFFDPSVAGITLVINLVDTLGTSRFSTGVFADPLSTPDNILVRSLTTTAGVTLIANNSITEDGSDPGADIIASTLVLSGTTGIGTLANALETQVGVIEAETNTGGINLSNFGTVSIGGLTADVDGLDVITSGNLVFTSFGSIVLSDESGPETMHGGTTSGDVILTASGVDSDILSNIDQDSISAPRGSIIVTAGRDIGFGLIGSNFDNDVRASGSITFNPGRDLLLDGFADVASDNFGNSTGGNIIVNAGRNITLLAVAGTDAGMEASGVSGADIILNTGPGGTVTLNSGNGTAPFASLISQSGDILVNADRMSIGTNGAISTVNGQVFLRPRTEGWDVILGSATDAAFALELSDAEIDRIFTTTLNVGSETAGQLNVIAAISPLNALNLELRAGTDIVLGASMTVGGNLSMFAGDSLFQLPASAINIGGNLAAFVDQAGDDLGAGGSGLFNGSVTATTSTLIGNFNSDILTGGGSNDVIFGFAGDDQITGNGGNDELRGQGGNDTVLGGAGADHLFGGPGNDTMDGGDDNDAMEGGADNDNMSGGLGNDVLFGVNGDDTLDGGSGDDELRGQSGTDTVTGGVGFDHLFGGPGNDELFGGADGDQLFGGADNDTLRGEGGNDLLTGELGSDLLLGGTGNDQFIFRTIADSLPGSADGVGDLAVGDLIDLTQIDANVGVGGDQAFTWIAAAAFSNVAGQLRATLIAPAQWLVEGDTNGDNVADFVLGVVIADGHVLAPADFIL